MTTETAKMEDPLKHAVFNEDVQALCKTFFDVELYPTQVEIVRDITFQREKNIVINAYTRYGKCGQFDIPTATGEIKKIEDIEIGDKVLSLNEETQEIVENKVNDKINNGEKPVYRLTTTSGRKVKTTKVHPYLTPDGWKQLHELKEGDRIAVPSNIPVEGNKKIEKHKVKLLAILLADGSCTAPRSYTFTNNDQRLADDLDKDLPEKFEVRTYEQKDKALKHAVRLKAEPSQRKNQHNINHWLDEAGLNGKKSADKEIPDIVFELENDQLALFLNRFFDCDGWASVGSNRESPEIGVSSMSEKMIQQIQHLLLRFGIISNVYSKNVKYESEEKTAHTLQLSGKENMLRFADEIGMFTKQKNLNEVVEVCEQRSTNGSNYNLPKKLFPEEHFKQYTKQYGGDFWINLQSDNVSYHTLEKIHDSHDDKHVEKHYDSDVYWDTIKNIEYLYDGTVYDIEVEKDHNFVANDVFAHNTYAVGIGLALYLLLKGEKLNDYRVGIVGPTESDAQNLRKEMLKAGINSEMFQEMLDTSRGSDPEDMLKSRNKDTLTLNDGAIEIHNVSASSGKSGDGSGAMGEGFDLIVMDESNRISHSFWKESGDRLREHEDSVLVEMGNPFHKDNQFYKHWTRNDFKKYHVGEEKGIEEGRHSKEWFDSRAKEVGGRQSLEYKVLYKSKFPDQVDDALIAHSWLERAEKNSFSFEDPEIIYGADIAGEGSDKIVVTRLEKENGKYRLTDQWSRDKSSDTGETAHWIEDTVPETAEDADRMVVDAVGIGAGVHSKLQELGFDAVKFKAGEKPVSEEDRFQNKKARNFFKLRDVLQENDLELAENFRHGRGNNLVHELTHIRTERRARDKVRIVDPDSGSPDFADSLMMCMYEGSKAWIL